MEKFPTTSTKFSTPQPLMRLDIFEFSTKMGGFPQSFPQSRRARSPAFRQKFPQKSLPFFPFFCRFSEFVRRGGVQIQPREIPRVRLVERLGRQEAVVPRSVFSHFAGSDSAGFDAFTHQQAARFDEAARMLQAAFPHKILRHICNSAGIERFPEYHHDMVRLGLGLYGISPVGDRLLHPISTLKSTILQIHDVPQEETVGYSRRGQLVRPSRIASLPIGYADGLNRRLGNGQGYCLVNGHKAPYVGNICMDVCMIDVTDIPCSEGDSVEIFGSHLPVTQLAQWLGTIPYEVLTGISTRVRRVYMVEN